VHALNAQDRCSAVELQNRQPDRVLACRGGRGIHREVERVIAPLHAEVPNIVDAKHVFTGVPALHVRPVELTPVVSALARGLLSP
jgi:hypothetical protein